LTIALFYAFGTGIGGVAGPAVFGALIDTGSREKVLWGYLLGGVLMLLAAMAELLLGLDAERRPLEEIAPPMSLSTSDPGSPSALADGRRKTRS
jgi:MFS family permease